MNASWNSGTPQSVVLSLSWTNGQPTGVSYSIVPSSGCTPTSGNNCTFTVNIGTSASTPTGTYPFTVSGLPVSSNGPLLYSLRVTPGLSGGSTNVTGVPNPDST